MPIGRALLDLTGEIRCVGCRAQPGPLCPRCRRRLRAPQSPGAPVPGVDAVSAPWAYEGGARALVLALKLGGQKSAAEPLSTAMAGASACFGVRADVITWVPGRRSDIRARGFDHAEVLAAGVARRLGLPAVRLLGRSARRPQDQASLGAAERVANLEGAFFATPCAGLSVLLVDDLVTTGATVGCCAGVLRAAGAAGVEIAAACRASLDFEAARP